MPFDYPTPSQPNQVLTVNEALVALVPAAGFGRRPRTTVGLNFGLLGATVRISGTPTIIANQVVVLTDNATNYIRVNPSGVVSVVTSAPSGWPGPITGYTALYDVVMVSGQISIVGGVEQVNDWRESPAATSISGGTVPTGTGFVHITSGAQDGAAVSVDLATADVTGLLPTANIAGDAITNAKLANMATATIKGRTTAGTGDPEDLTAAQAAAVLGTNVKSTESIIIACSDEATSLTTGTAKLTFRMPYAFTVTDVRASLTVAQASGSIFTVDVNESGTTIISTKLTIDNTEKTSTTAATPRVISDSSLADDAEMTIDIDQIGDGTAKGLKVVLIGNRT